MFTGSFFLEGELVLVRTSKRSNDSGRATVQGSHSLLFTHWDLYGSTGTRLDEVVCVWCRIGVLESYKIILSLVISSGEI